MKRYAAVLGFGVLLSLTCFGQQTSWRSEQYDFLLVAPNATEVKYVNWPNGVHQLIYNVEEPYPALYVLGVICTDLQQKGWELQPGAPDVNRWWKTGFDVPGKSRTQYRWSGTWGNEENEGLSYTLDYTDSKNDHYLRTLHVEAIYSDGIAARQNAARAREELERAKAQEKLHNRVIRYQYGAGAVAYLAVLATPLILQFRKSQYTAFYRGPQAWLTSINLLLFGTLATPLLWLGASAIAALIGKESLLVAGVAGVVVMMMFARVGYIVYAIVPLLVVGILRSEKIPKPVKIVHCALGAATFIFFALCIASFSGPLIQW